ncbi:MAG TPA: hypothetical protein VI258_10285, partial [Rhodanobacteraceae bacterium]
GETVYVEASDEAAARLRLPVARTRGGFRFEYSDGSTFWINRAGRTIRMSWRGDFASACTYLVGPILGFVLRLRGDLALHASAVDIGGVALAIAGPHGSGKSTTAAALAQAGYPVLADDILRVTCDEGRWHAHACGSVLRLWPDGAALVCDRDDDLTDIAPGWEKRALAIGRGKVAAAVPRLPLAAIVLLDREAVSSAPAPFAPASAVVALAANTTAGYMLDGPGRAREFSQLIQLAADVPCLTAGRPRVTRAGIAAFVDAVRAITNPTVVVA